MAVTMKTSEPQGQLQRNPPSNTLSLNIWEEREEGVQEEGAAASFDVEHYISCLCPIANISALELCINSRGHVCGALVLHLLEVYTLIKRLKVDLCKFQVICLSFCLMYILNFRRSCWRWGL